MKKAGEAGRRRVAKVKPKRARRTTDEKRSPAPRRNRAVKTTVIQTMTPKVKVNRKARVRVNPKARVNRNPKVKAKVNRNPKAKVNLKVKVNRRSLREENGARRAKRRRKARRGSRGSCAYLVYNFLKSVKYIFVSSIK